MNLTKNYFIAIFQTDGIGLESTATSILGLNF